VGGAATSGPGGPPLPALGMSNSYHGEPYIPADIFNVSCRIPSSPVTGQGGRCPMTTVGAFTSVRCRPAGR
jgi:hypothetical protein